MPEPTTTFASVQAELEVLIAANLAVISANNTNELRKALSILQGVNDAMKQPVGLP